LKVEKRSDGTRSKFVIHSGFLSSISRGYQILAYYYNHQRGWGIRFVDESSADAFLYDVEVLPILLDNGYMLSVGKSDMGIQFEDYLEQYIADGARRRVNFGFRFTGFGGNHPTFIFQR
jgi:hypothetical protein